MMLVVHPDPGLWCCHGEVQAASVVTGVQQLRGHQPLTQSSAHASRYTPKNPVACAYPGMTVPRCTGYETEIKSRLDHSALYLKTHVL